MVLATYLTASLHITNNAYAKARAKFANAYYIFMLEECIDN